MQSIMLLIFVDIFVQCSSLRLTYCSNTLQQTAVSAMRLHVYTVLNIPYVWPRAAYRLHLLAGLGQFHHVIGHFTTGRLHHVGDTVQEKNRYEVNMPVIHVDAIYLFWFKDRGWASNALFLFFYVNATAQYISICRTHGVVWELIFGKFFRTIKMASPRNAQAIKHDS